MCIRDRLYRRRIENRGITLVALIVTIVVLLILAGVSIGALTNRKGLIPVSYTHLKKIFSGLWNVARKS